jgi:hypothetical protein
MQRAPKVVCCLLIVQILLVSKLRAENEQPKKPDGHTATQTSQSPPSKKESTHRFWDATNAGLFLGVSGARALDYASTVGFRSRGVDEILLSNSTVDNHPLFAGIEAAGVAASIGVSYLFHRTGHHKLERWVSIVHISVGVGGSIRNFGLERHTALSPAQ